MFPAPVIVVGAGRLAGRQLVEGGSPGLGVQMPGEICVTGGDCPEVDLRAGACGRRRGRDDDRLSPSFQRGCTQELDAWLAADLVGIQVHAGERLAPAARTDREHHDPARPIECVGALRTGPEGDHGPGLKRALTA